MASDRVHRPADRADDDHSVDQHQRVDAARLLRQSDRRLDVRVSCVRVRCATRVRARQCPRSTPWTPHPAFHPAAAVRSARLPSSADTAATARRTGSQHRREPT